MKLSGLEKTKIRFIVDDVRKFVEREIKRGVKYDVVLLDPPVYGKGAKKEVWKIEEDLLPFLHRVKQVLSDSPVAIVLNGYASVYSSVTYRQLLETITNDLKGNISDGELAIKESSGGRLLTSGIFARWEKYE
jgi:23S rRNA (cytosine1962-C5)-methyltransferase